MTTGHARLCVLAGTVLFGTTGTAQALGPAGMTASHVGAVRVGLGGLLLLVVTGLAGAVRDLRSWPLGALLGAGLATAAFQVAFFAAIARTGVAIGSTVAIAATPVLTGALAAVMTGRFPGRGWAVATALAVTGAVALCLDGAASDVDPTGVLLAVAAAGGFAAATLLTKRLVDAGHAPSGVVAVTFCVAGVLLAPTLIAGDTSPLTTAAGVATIAYLVLVPTVIGYVLFARGLVGLPGADAVTLTLAELLVAAALGVFLLGERPGLVAVGGSLLLVAGLVVAIRSTPS
ncbi:MAG: drug/metabolite transporter, family [Solirubrobacteraceae bacterium]|jgi:DME family drug/metabolite transporter|nr:drug/metabolite transporter, family [Solirubrobacteraceae bacterium]